MNCHANTANAGCVRLRHIVTGSDRHAGHHLDLATNMQQEGLIGNAANLYIFDTFDRVNNLNCVFVTRRVDGKVTHHIAF